MTRFALMLALWPLPALADLPPPIAAALDLCLAEGTDIAARAGTALAAGWQPVAEADRPAAALAFAPYRLISMNVRPLTDMSQEERTDRLRRMADSELAHAGDPLTQDVWLTDPASGAFLRILDQSGAGVVSCSLSADITAAAYAAALSVPAEVRHLGVLTFSIIHTGDDTLSSPNLFTFAPDTFQGLTIPPLLITPYRPITQ